MHKQVTLNARAGLLAALVVFVPCVSLAGTPLFTDTNAVGLVQDIDELALRERNVQVDINTLRFGKNDSFDVELFDGKTITVIRDAEEPAPGGYVWKGHVEGQPDSFAIFSVVEDAVSGNITLLSGELYRIRSLGMGVHALQEMDPAGLPEAESVEPKPEELGPSNMEKMADTGGTIDVMVVYTAQARAAVGSVTAMQSLINQAVSETNTTYANSGINQRVRLVHSAEVTYTETGDISTDLGRLRSTTDGYMDNVHTLRNTYKADLVSLFVVNGGSYCGIAYIMTSVSTSFAPNGFSVVDKDCATGYYSFGHEMGHNMSARHDRYVDNTNGSPYNYNHCHYNTAGRWRTVMAYNNACSAVGVSCTRIPYWSNPTKTYNGAAMGVTGSVDNRLTLNNTAYTVANFRASQ